MSTITMSGFSFRASALFPPAFPIEQGPPGIIAIYVPEGISPISLRQSAIGKELLLQQVWYDNEPWANESLSPGLYHLRLPVPESNLKTFDQQKLLLLDTELAAPLVLVELAMLCLKKAGHPDPLNGGWVRCRETAGDDRHVALDWDGGRLRVDDRWGDYRYSSVWLVSVRRTS